MSSLNKAQVIGNLARDVELRYTQDNKPIANMTVVTSEKWKDQSGQQQEKAEFHRVVVFGPVAEVCNKYLQKGSKVFIEGKLQTRKWQGQDGKDNYSTEIVVDRGGKMLMLGGNNSGMQQGSQVSPESMGVDASDIDDQDIPF
jgi:single-strand DNA-binding protein